MGAQPIMPEKVPERNGGKSLDLDCLIGLMDERHLANFSSYTGLNGPGV